jgi:L-ascorbate metabolism protein UlaG (beta-lactamase superfamily)
VNRKKFLKTSFSLAGITIAGKFMIANDKILKVSSYTSNVALETINPAWKGTPLDQDGLFMNHEFPFIHKFSTALKWMMEKNPYREQKKNDTWRIEVIENDKFVEDNADKIVWLGHASFYIQLSGTRILIDPVLGKLAVGNRYSALPISPEKLLNIDYILVSHAHYDHCDKDSIKLLAIQNPKAKILTGLKLDKLLKNWASNDIQAAGWYQQYSNTDDLKITYLPSRHWGNRTPFDVNETLWGGFMIQKGDLTIYFGGDSGYGSHFKDIGNLFPSINVALIGAGAFAPAWFMGPNHQTPQDAVKAFAETGAKTFIPFHYGTFDAADEPLGEPEKILRMLENEGQIANKLKILKLGEVFAIL